MEDFKALKIFLFSIINLLTYLLSIYFYTSLYTKSLMVNSRNFQGILNSHIKQVRISFGFHCVAFIFFAISLFIIIYNSDLGSKSLNEKIQNENIQNENENVPSGNILNENENVPSGNILNENENVPSGNILNENENVPSGNIQNENIPNENFNFYKINDNALLILFGVCQIFFVLNLIFISISCGRIKAKKLENVNENDKIIDNYIKRISIELVAVGYIFFSILFALSIWALLITDKKLNFLPYIKNKFQSFEDILKNRIEDTSEKLQNKIRQLDEGLQRLRNENLRKEDAISEIVPIVHH
jgi:hypothetical protein